MKKDDWIPRSTTTWYADSLTTASPLTAPSYRSWSRRMRQRWAEAFKRLEASHSLICHPGHTAPWVIHPFSLSPTATWCRLGNWVGGRRASGARSASAYELDVE